MKYVYPCVEINLEKVEHNAKTIVDMCANMGIKVVGVSKVFCGQKPVVQAMINGGIEVIGDSRMENLKKIKDLKCQKLLLRIPMESNADKVVKYSDISLNSEIETIKKISKAAKKINKIHGIILMIDIGDLREGVLEKDALNVIEQILNLNNVNLCGIGTNLTCYGGVIPDENNLGVLIKIKKEAEKLFNIEIPILSGGNSSSIYLVMNNRMPKGINQLRIGEGIVLGRETAFGENIPNCYTNCFILKGEIIEAKYKPSIPLGNIGKDAFGNKPHFEDRGIIKRAIVAIGRQDINANGLIPLDDKIDVLGASSDHLLMDITKSDKTYIIGDVIDFKMDYGCLLIAMTSPYVKKYYVGTVNI